MLLRVGTLNITYCRACFSLRFSYPYLTLRPQRRAARLLFLAHQENKAYFLVLDRQEGKTIPSLYLYTYIYIYIYYMLHSMMPYYEPLSVGFGVKFGGLGFREGSLRDNLRYT